MERIIINQLLYTCKNGTNDKIRKLLKEGEQATAMQHENGTAYQKFNDFLWSIIDTKNGVYVENVYQTN